MEDIKVHLVWAVALCLLFGALCAGLVRGCDNETRMKVECLKAGKDPLACDRMGRP